MKIMRHSNKTGLHSEMQHYQQKGSLWLRIVNEFIMWYHGEKKEILTIFLKICTDKSIKMWGAKSHPLSPLKNQSMKDKHL